MSVSTVDVDLVPSQNAPHDTNLCGFTTLIREDEPRTPQVARQILQDIQLSSPAANYDLESMQPSQGLRTYPMQYKCSDTERPIKANGIVTEIEIRLNALEKAMKEARQEQEEAIANVQIRMSEFRKAMEVEREEIRQEREELKEQEEITLRWVVCDRLAQGLNDRLKSSIMQSKDRKLTQALKIISSEGDWSRYLPQLITRWWVFWHATASDLYPLLPRALASLNEQEKALYLSRGCLPPHVDQAIQTIWQSDEHRSIVELMLKIYNMRPKDRNSNQYLVPSAASAYAFMHSDRDITEDQKTMVRLVIRHGTRREMSGEETFLFN